MLRVIKLFVYSLKIILTLLYHQSSNYSAIKTYICMYSRMYSRHLLLLAITNFVLTFTLTDAIDLRRRQIVATYPRDLPNIRNSLTAV